MKILYRKTTKIVWLEGILKYVMENDRTILKRTPQNNKVKKASTIQPHPQLWIRLK